MVDTFVAGEILQDPALSMLLSPSCEHVVCEIARFVHQPSSDDLAKVFSWTMIVCHDVNGFATLAGGADAPIHVCRDHSLLWLLVCVFCVGVTGFRRSYADNFGVVAGGVESTSVHLANVIAGREGQDRMSVASPLPVGVSVIRIVQWSGQEGCSNSCGGSDSRHSETHQWHGNGTCWWARVVLGLTDSPWSAVDFRCQEQSHVA